MKKLYRSRKDRKIWGVCGGFANYLGIDPTLVRVIATVLIILSGMGVLVYILVAFIIPLEGSTT